MEKSSQKLIIIDANSVIHRAFHALPPLKNKKGQIVGAVYGFLLVFFKAVKDFNPDFIIAAFDFPAPTFRHKKYDGYKAKRIKAPQELYDQIPEVKKILSVFNVPVLSMEGFEADDIVATVAQSAFLKKTEPKIETIILTGDSDSFQLINSGIKVYALRKGIKDTILYDEKTIKNNYSGLTPKQLLDYKSLRGDPSDNIPGVTGVGEKTATDLILKFKTLENLYNEIEKNSEKAKTLKPKTKEILLKYKDQAFLSKELVSPEKNVPIDFDFEKSRWHDHDKEKIIEVLNNFGFRSLVERITGQKKETKIGKKSEQQSGQRSLL